MFISTGPENVFVKNQYSFKISYKNKNGEIIFTFPNYFMIEKNQINFIYDASKKGYLCARKD